jgi:uncharacterized membrane protein
MAEDSPNWRLLLPESVRTLPADLAAVLLLTALTVLAIFMPVVQDSPLRVILGLPFVLFIPGYAFIAALFPEAGDPPTEDDETGDRSGIDAIERVALSFGLSIAIVPLIGLVLNFTPFGIRLVPIVVSVSAFTVGSTAVAAHRRRALPTEERFAVPYRQWLHAGRVELFEPDSRVDAALNVLLVLSILLAVSSVAYAVAVPKEGEAFTESYLLTEQENGTLVADDYPTEFSAGESKPIVVGIVNHEHRETSYSMVVELQQVRFENNSTIVEDEEELRRFQTTLADGERLHKNLNITPSMTGERLRLAFLLYEGDPPADPSVESAYRETHLWVNVTQTNNDTS